MESLKKTCKRCNLEKSYTSFYKQKGMKDGHLSYCKDCTTSRVKTHRENNSEVVKQYDRSRSKSEKRRQHNRENSAKYRAENKEKRKQTLAEQKAKYPEKYKARYAVSNAIRDKRVFKQPCKCGETKVEAHHSDYSKPLEVIWLCSKCHGEEHQVYD